MKHVIDPVGYVRGGRATLDDDHWGDVTTVIELTENYGPDALAGLGAFTHAEIIFVFDQVPTDKIETGARHPRGRADWPVIGIFAQRGKNRPNRIGITMAEIIAVSGNRVELRGLDAIDGTPVIDIKPVMSGFLPRSALGEPAWAKELMANYW